MSDQPRRAGQTPYAFGTMTFVFGLAIGAVLGGLFLMDRDDDDPAPPPSTQAAQPTEAQLTALENELEDRERKIDDLQAEMQRIQQELEAMLNQSDGEPGALQLAQEHVAAQQAEIDSLSEELGRAYEELGRLGEQSAAGHVVTHYVFILQELHGFAQNGFAEGETYAADPALNDALAELDDPALTDAVLAGFLGSSAAATEPLYTALQTVLNHMQELLVT